MKTNHALLAAALIAAPFVASLATAQEASTFGVKVGRLEPARSNTFVNVSVTRTAGETGVARVTCSTLDAAGAVLATAQGTRMSALAIGETAVRRVSVAGLGAVSATCSAE